jgi:hypothetical protein
MDLPVAPLEDLRSANPHPRWYVLVIILAICGLTVSLATRTFRLTTPHAVTAQSVDSHAMRQHMDCDGAQWAPPVPILTTLQAPVFYPRVAPAGPPIPSVLFDESLSNRPPPSC